MRDGERFVIVPDNHGDMVDDDAASALWAFLEEWRPQIRIHGGDCWDFRNLRRGATDDEKAASLVDDWEAGLDFMRRLFDGGETRVFLRGNHDERMWQFRNSATGLLRDYATDGVKRIEGHVARLKAKMLPYDSELGVYHLGRLSVLHGYHHGIGAVRTHANIYRNCVICHVHTIESAPVPSLEPVEARSIGCMCRRDMDYVNRKTAKLRWGQGWAAGVLFADGSYTLYQVRNDNGRWVWPKDVVVHQ